MNIISHLRQTFYMYSCHCNCKCYILYPTSYMCSLYTYSCQGATNSQRMAEGTFPLKPVNIKLNKMLIRTTAQVLYSSYC